MIDGNRLIFGYGTISVTYQPFMRALQFMTIKPPQNIGTDLKNSNAQYVGKSVYICIELEQISEFNKLLDNVTNEPIFEYGGYIFDFSENKVESINAVRKVFNTLTSSYEYLIGYAS